MTVARQTLAALAVTAAAALPAHAQEVPVPEPAPPPPPAYQFVEQPIPQPPPPEPGPAAESSPNSDYALLPDRLIEGLRTKSEVVADFPDSDLQRLGMPVGLLNVSARRPGQMDSSISFPCTAWLVDDAVVLTAWHCMPGLPAEARAQGYKPTTASVSFQFESAASIPDIYPVTAVIASDEALDYALLELGTGSGRAAPGQTYGVIKLIGDRVQPGTPLQVYHHPYGYYKMVLKDGTCRSFAPPAAQESRLYHQCDTRGGSSGAPVLLYQTKSDADGKRALVAVGLHTRGNANGMSNRNSDFNTATAVSALLASNNYLNQIACHREATAIECPDPAAARPVTVYFDWDRSDITAEAAATLDRLIEKLKNQSWEALTIEGHTDTSNSASYAVGLSQRQADSVKAYLTGRGIDPAKITTEAFGSSRPAFATPPATREPRNRRAVIRVQ